MKITALQKCEIRKSVNKFTDNMFEFFSSLHLKIFIMKYKLEEVSNSELQGNL